MENLTFRLENKNDYRAVENLVRDSFWNVYRPGAFEHYVLHVLRENDDFVNDLDIIMEKDGELIGQVAFFKAKIKTDGGEDLPILTVGPICIKNEYKRKGYGKKLLDYALSLAESKGYGAVCFEGNYDFYSKCGFTYARNFSIRYHGLPQGEDDSFFLCKELKKGFLSGKSGEYATPSAYLVSEADVEKFDESFPKKEKLKLPGQIF